VVLLLHQATRPGRSCPWDGASATFSTLDSFPSRLPLSTLDQRSVREESYSYQ
jgi:hypothetical protein